MWQLRPLPQANENNFSCATAFTRTYRSLFRFSGENQSNVWRSELRNPHWEEPARSALFDLILKFYNKRYSLDRQWRPLHLPTKY